MGKEIDTRFDYHQPDQHQQTRMAGLRAQFKALAERLDEELPVSRETSLALTYLEQAQFYANAAIARREA
jgi:hypothetical protein